MCCFTYNSVFALSGPATIANQNISRSSLGVGQNWLTSKNINIIVIITYLRDKKNANLNLSLIFPGCCSNGGDVHAVGADLPRRLLLLPHTEEEVPR